jgi:hypothetical protein
VSVLELETVVNIWSRSRWSETVFDGTSEVGTIGLDQRDSQWSFTVGVGAHNAAMAHVAGEFALQQRHSDGTRWVVVATFGTKQDAQEALDKAVDRGARSADLRVKKLR